MADQVTATKEEEVIQTTEASEATGVTQTGDPQETGTPKDYNKTEWALAERAERGQMFELQDATAMRVVASGEVLKNYLNLSARFPNHSAGNQLLIFAAMPEATKVGDYKYWKQHATPVKKEAKSVITVLKRAGKYTREDGTTKISYKARKVFDISQTSAEPVPKPEYDAQKLVDALIANQEVRIEQVPELPDLKIAEYDNAEKTVSVLTDANPEATFRALTIELVQANFAKDNPDYDRNAYVFTSVLASYTLCERYGVNSQSLDFERITPLMTAFEKPQEARKLLSDVRAAAGELSSHIAQNLDKGAAEKTTEKNVEVIEVVAQSPKAPELSER
jgi:hypothetical protein